MGLWLTLLYAGGVAAAVATINPSVTSAENTKLTPTSSTTFGAVYREPRDYNAHDTAAANNGYSYRPYDRPQTSRCISCLYAAMTGNQAVQDR